jgi:hypothetical protein
VKCEETAKLDRDGFVVKDRHLRDQTVDSLIASLAAGTEADGDFAGVRRKRGVAFARRNLLSVAPVRSFLACNEIRSLHEIIAPDSIPVRAILFDKTGDANWTVPWHQDRSIAVRERIDIEGFGPWSNKSGVVHVQPPLEVLRRMITLRFSLDACDAENGPLRAIAGTHQTILDPEAVDDAARRKPQSICTTDVGGVVMMRPLLLHASSPATRVGHRRVLHVEFGPPGLPGGLRWAVA